MVALATENALDADVHAAVMGAVLAMLAAPGKLAIAVPAASPQLDRARAHLGANPMGLQLVAHDHDPMAVACHADLVLALPNPRVKGSAARVAGSARTLRDWGANVLGLRGSDPTDADAIADADPTGVMPLLTNLLRAQQAITDRA